MPNFDQDSIITKCDLALTCLKMDEPNRKIDYIIDAMLNQPSNQNKQSVTPFEINSMHWYDAGIPKFTSDIDEMFNIGKRRGLNISVIDKKDHFIASCTVKSGNIASMPSKNAIYAILNLILFLDITTIS